ncbi:MAG: hypothetical protein ACLUTJ_00925 [Phocaeicola massiliensis]
MRKQFIQQSNSQKRAKNFVDTITSDDTLQIIVGQDNSGTFFVVARRILYGVVFGCMQYVHKAK